MITQSTDAPVGLLLSGGLDSSILLGHLVDSGYCVQPFYIRANLIWEKAELEACHRFLARFAHLLSTRTDHSVRPLIELQLPVDDLYDRHWSTTGGETPAAGSEDAAVFLPGRNPLLVIKAALWCALNGIEQLVLAPLAANPFADARPSFFDAFERALNYSTRDHETCGPVRLVRPFADCDKREVMRLGRELPLELTFSCIRPVDGSHCGECNKCAERQAAFAAGGMDDPTAYAARSMR